VRPRVAITDMYVGDELFHQNYYVRVIFYRIDITDVTLWVTTEKQGVGVQSDHQYDKYNIISRTMCINGSKLVRMLFNKRHRAYCSRLEKLDKGKPQLCLIQTELCALMDRKS
jgi:hypothetical protein